MIFIVLSFLFVSTNAFSQADAETLVREYSYDYYYDSFDYGEQSQYKINELRLDLKSVNSSQSTTVNGDGATTNDSFVGVGGSYQYDVPKGKYIGSLLANGNYQRDLNSKSVSFIRGQAELKKEVGKNNFNLKVIASLKVDESNLTYIPLNSQFFSEYERRQLAQIAGVDPNGATTDLGDVSEVQNTVSRIKFTDEYKRNSGSKLGLDFTLSQYEIAGSYDSGVDANIERRLFQTKLSGEESIYRLWSLGLSVDYGFLNETDTNSLSSEDVYSIQTDSQNAEIYMLRKTSPEKYVKLYIDYNGLVYSLGGKEDIYRPGVIWANKVNSRTVFKLDLSEGFIVQDGVLSGSFYPSFNITRIPNAKSTISFKASRELENIIEYFFFSEAISSPLQESIIERESLSLVGDYKMRRSSMSLTALLAKRTYLGSDQDENQQNIRALYKYIISRKMDLGLTASYYLRTREAIDDQLSYNSDGYYVDFSFKYSSRSTRRARGDASVDLNYRIGSSYSNRSGEKDEQSLISLNVNWKV